MATKTKSISTAHRAKRPSSRSSGVDLSFNTALALSVVTVRSQVETCVTLLRSAEAAIRASQIDLAMDRVLDVEPILFEAKTILDAVVILKRYVVKAAASQAEN